MVLTTALLAFVIPSSEETKNSACDRKLFYFYTNLAIICSWPFINVFNWNIVSLLLYLGIANVCHYKILLFQNKEKPEMKKSSPVAICQIMKEAKYVIKLKDYIPILISSNEWSTHASLFCFLLWQSSSAFFLSFIVIIVIYRNMKGQSNFRN